MQPGWSLISVKFEKIPWPQNSHTNNRAIFSVVDVDDVDVATAAAAAAAPIGSLLLSVLSFISTPSVARTYGKLGAVGQDLAVTPRKERQYS